MTNREKAEEIAESGCAGDLIYRIEKALDEKDKEIRELEKQIAGLMSGMNLPVYKNAFDEMERKFQAAREVAIDLGVLYQSVGNSSRWPLEGELKEQFIDAEIARRLAKGEGQ